MKRREANGDYHSHRRILALEKLNQLRGELDELVPPFLSPRFFFFR